MTCRKSGRCSLRLQNFKMAADRRRKKRPELSEEQRQEITEAFNLFDTDKDQALDYHELKVRGDKKRILTCTAILLCIIDACMIDRVMIYMHIIYIFGVCCSIASSLVDPKMTVYN